jgi:hypothetical protein
MLTKEKVMNSLQNMPGTFSIDELIDKLILLLKIETGLEQSKKSEVLPAKEVKKC